MGSTRQAPPLSALGGLQSMADAIREARARDEASLLPSRCPGDEIQGSGATIDAPETA